ncbi:MAG TPA: glycosyltransferase family 2 protein [Pyrinomonadaceae bacterium]|jgi:glycosyltransferase involved in cell wall biosynthesis|nr:glycosyltransferase family 2 protein [Pyrinomonadaceae bacterium]
MKQVLFSVIIPSYNCGRKLEATIESVLSQPEGMYELVVVDGGSDDETLAVIRKFAGRLRYVSESDRGVYDAMNKGVAMSSGKYVFILGGGDRLRDGVLSRAAKLLPDGPSFVYGDAYLERHGVLMGGAIEKTNFIRTNICQQAIFYERTVFEMLGGFDLKYKVYADWAFNMKCFADARLRKVYLRLVVADFEGWGISDTQADANFVNDFPALIRRHVGLSHYARYRIYLARCSFYRFRHGLADFIKQTARRPGSMLRRQ